ncbi:ABC transporter substrate-binding protein [Spirosoma arcticum]
MPNLCSRTPFMTSQIISVVPSQTELLFDLGLDAEIVGITKFCIHPAEKIQTKTIVGGTKTLHLDQIHALQPDLILANKEENTREQIEELQRHYSVHITDVVTLPDALTMIREVGRLVGKKQQADEMASQIAFSLASHSSRSSPSSSVAYFIWRKPYMVAAGGTFIDAMLQAAGFQNAFVGQTRYPEIAPDDLRAANPDMIFLSSEPYPFAQKHVAELRAICPSARVMVVDGEVFSWYGSRLLRADRYFRNLHTEIARTA